MRTELQIGPIRRNPLLPRVRYLTGEVMRHLSGVQPEVLRAARAAPDEIAFWHAWYAQDEEAEAEVARHVRDDDPATVLTLADKRLLRGRDFHPPFPEASLPQALVDGVAWADVPDGPLTVASVQIDGRTHRTKARFDHVRVDCLLGGEPAAARVAEREGGLEPAARPPKRPPPASPFDRRQKPQRQQLRQPTLAQRINQHGARVVASMTGDGAPVRAADLFARGRAREVSIPRLDV